jgi:glycosyltransferase involved in cell wall biosynthesis
MHKNRSLDHIPYVLVTPARNEGKFIEKVIQSVTNQTVSPSKWVIVNDGSTDATANIVSRYLAKCEWMELLNLSPHRDRSFAAKVHAFNADSEKVKNLEYEVNEIGR